MNLSKLFEIQRALDERIVREHGLEGQDLLPMKILALQVELGELANEWRGFKFWSNDREPVRFRRQMKGYPINDIVESDPLLEEYVDCLHFILSIGMEFGNTPEITQKYLEPFVGSSIVDQFNAVLKSSCDIDVSPERESDEHNDQTWGMLLSYFVGLGQMLGFTWEQIEQAYLAKNAVNHQRQDGGY